MPGLGLHLPGHTGRQPSLTGRCLDHAGAAATEAEARKRSKYSSLAATYYFVPVAVETLGALGEEAAQFISNLSRRITATTSEPRSAAFLFQRLSVATQRGNAASVTGTSAQSAKLGDILFAVEKSLFVPVVLFSTVHDDFR